MLTEERLSEIKARAVEATASPNERKPAMKCEQHHYLLIRASRVTGMDNNNHRYEVRLCRDCGQFEVFGDVNFQQFDISFELVTQELVTAAGQYLRLLQEADRLKELPPDELMRLSGAAELPGLEA